MNCREFVDFLMSYLDGEISAEMREVFEAHIEACPPCVRYLETYQEAVQMGKTVCSADDEDVPQDVPEELVQAILAARHDR